MIYRITNDSEHYLIPDIGPQQYLETFDDAELVAKLMTQPATNDALQCDWLPLHFSMHNASTRQQAVNVPDITLWHSGLVLMPQAFDYLHRQLEPLGEWLTGMCDDQPVSLFNCLTFGREDPTQTLTKYIHSEPVGLSHLAFELTDLKNKLLFKSERQGGQFLYCDDRFKGIYGLCDLTGLSFSTQLLPVF